MLNNCFTVHRWQGPGGNVRYRPEVFVRGQPRLMGLFPTEWEAARAAENAVQHLCDDRPPGYYEYRFLPLGRPLPEVENFRRTLGMRKFPSLPKLKNPLLTFGEIFPRGHVEINLFGMIGGPQALALRDALRVAVHDVLKARGLLPDQAPPLSH